jgi:hypothetical protein
VILRCQELFGSRGGVDGVWWTTSTALEVRVRRSLAVVLPDGWVPIEAVGPGPFVTSLRVRRPDGAVVTWASREQRKLHSVLDTGRGSTWWAPGAVGWWIGVLFAVGSVCFAVGAAPGYVDAVGVGADGITFFVGSVFFTGAACLQYLEVANASRALPGPEARDHRRFLNVDVRSVGWWAAVSQLGGTLLFNVSTFDAMLQHLSASEANRLVWRPDALGSILFLVASGLAWSEVSNGLWSWRPRRLSWWITALNLCGSLAFGASALAAHVVPATDQPHNVALMNLGTFLGALGFLVAAVLLLPERTQVSTEPQFT